MSNSNNPTFDALSKILDADPPKEFDAIVVTDRRIETHDDAVRRYLDHPKDETFEQRKARINRFRCGF